MNDLDKMINDFIKRNYKTLLIVGVYIFALWIIWSL